MQLSIEEIKQIVAALQQARQERLKDLELNDPVLQNLNGQLIAYSNILGVDGNGKNKE